MVKNFAWSLAALAGSVVATAPATAQTATVSVTGSIMSGFDNGGVFGPAAANLAGQAFSAVFNIKGGTGANATSGAGFSSLIGEGAASPLDAYLTIGGVTHYFSGSAKGIAQAKDLAGNGGTDQVLYFTDSTDYSASQIKQTLFYVSVDTLRNIFSSADFTNYGTVNVTLADNAKGFALISNYDPTTGTYGGTTYADLAVKTIGAKVGAAVPEPATWMLMIAGFGAVGYSVRRRRATIAMPQMA